ncbi:NADH:ubiquinone oxidoreductase complex I intermediate-associated protein 30 [Marinobacter santoriniensis NKSG1]|uniref:NADH:ubiquinone oxidoreductase complex I intermediate-associated protein 30 n=1 Tax=Marinobacter santoriniensis NKSG1 TaxID=1288826 RepID=M7CWY9_9GAMM|nr:CIA30 family protein [Marinobacter santoriniensis]EMP56755.1 NADH:ubiquinone oxidoreductase complex I intermediate-associated protein 30 [Marinobacter santoriniensis NKSG1]
MNETHSTSDGTPGRTLVAFDGQRNELYWQPLGDQVMGGQSEGNLVSSADGVGLFQGIVRLDNGGGFASVKADFPEPVDATRWTGIELLAKGDGKTYKIGLRNSTDRGSIVYQHSFTPDTEDWSRIRLPFSEFIPTWRGKTLTDVEPLDLAHLASVSLFVSGRQIGEFRLRMQDWRLMQ